MSTADLRNLGRIMVKLRPGTPIARLPAHVDVLAGACRALGTVDGGGRIDKAVLGRSHAARARRAFHARQSFGRMGEQASRFDDREQAFGLPDVLGIQLSDPEATEATVAALRDLEQVEWAMAEPLALAPLRSSAVRAFGERTPSATEVTRAHERVGAARALEIEPGRPDVLCAVVDTGVALEHPEFIGRLRAGSDTVDLGMGSLAGGAKLVGDSRGRDYCPRDETGHGSHVAGIICARGLKLPQGLAGQCAGIPVRVLAAADVGNGELVGIGGTLDIDAGLQVAHTQGAIVFNMSFGTAADTVDIGAPPPHADIIDYIVAEGGVCVAAMGNSGGTDLYYPAALPGVIAVGSVDAAGRVSEFSTRGEHISLSAPGEHIISAGLRGYRDSSGTSHAAPFVTGTVALMVAHARRLGREATSPLIRRALVESAAEAAPGSRPEEVGAGILDAPAALKRLAQLLDGKDEAHG